MIDCIIVKLTARETVKLLPAGHFPMYLDDVDIRRAAGDRVVHLPHLAVSLHSNEFDGHRDPPTCENGSVHHLCFLETDKEKKTLNSECRPVRK